jgi:hypothetical protein
MVANAVDVFVPMRDAIKELRIMLSKAAFLHSGSSFLLFVSGFALILILAGCGAGSATGSSGPPPTPTTIKGYGTTYGCPSDAVVSSPPPANVTIQASQVNTTITAHVGDIIEIHLPFGSKWSGPTTSQGNLQLLTPAGFAMKSASVCVWQFSAKSTGTTQLIFEKRALCKAGELCPQYIVNVPFTIDVK